MKNDIVFSIIIPAYNAEKTIEKSINSVEKQGVKCVEIVVVNDGSIDNTQKVIQKCQEKYQNIKLIEKRHGGVASARNFGIDNAEGKYLIFLDADDELCDEALSLLYKFYLKKGSFDMLICDSYSYTNIDTDTVHIDKMFYNINYEDLSFFETKVLCQNLSSMCIGVFCKEFLHKNSLYVKDGISVGEDTDFIFRSILRCETIYIVECNLFIYKYNQSSIMRNINKKNILDMLTVCDERINDLLENKYIDINKDKALDFFSGKFIQFGIKLNRLPREDRKEIILFIKSKKHITRYSKSFSGRVFCLLVYLHCVSLACFVFDSTVKIRNIIKI